MIIINATLLSAIDGLESNLGELRIANDGTGTATRGNYNVKLYSAGKKPRLIRTARIENWPRKSKTAWALVTEAVNAVNKS